MSTSSVNQQDSSQTTINVTDTVTVNNVEGSLTLQGKTIIPNLSTQTIQSNGFLIVKEKCTFNNPVNFESSFNLLKGFNQYVYFSKTGSVSFISSGSANSMSTAVFNSSLATVSALSFNLQQSLVNYINLAPYVASDGTVTDIIPLTSLSNIGGPYSTTLFNSIYYAPLTIDVTNGGSITNQNIGNYFLNGVMYTFINTYYENLVLQFPSGTFGGLYDSNGNTINSQVTITLLGNGGTFKFFTLQNTIYIVSLSPGSTYYGTYVNVPINTGDQYALFIAALFDLIVTKLNSIHGTIIQPYEIQTLTNIIYKVVAGVDTVFRDINNAIMFVLTHIPVVGVIYQDINNFINNTITTVVQYGVSKLLSINWPPQITADFKQAFATISQEMIIAGGTEFQVTIPSENYAVSVVVTIQQNKDYLQYLDLQQAQLLLQQQINQQKQIQSAYVSLVNNLVQSNISKLDQTIKNAAIHSIVHITSHVTVSVLKIILKRLIRIYLQNKFPDTQPGVVELGPQVTAAVGEVGPGLATVEPELQTLVDTVAAEAPAIEASVATEAGLVEQLAIITEQVVSTIAAVASQVADFIASLSEIIASIVTSIVGLIKTVATFIPL